jgi:hypothetical protein
MPYMRHSLIVSALAMLLVACTGGSPPESPTAVPPTATPVPLENASSLHQVQIDAINDAVQAAQVGCEGIDERLSGPPTRILAALTGMERAASNRFVSSGAGFVFGPHGINDITAAWVVAVEGPVAPVSREGAPDEDQRLLRAFVFALDVGNPQFTHCVVRDAPMPTRHYDFFNSGFEFEVMFDSG